MVTWVPSGAMTWTLGSWEVEQPVYAYAEDTHTLNSVLWLTFKVLPDVDLRFLLLTLELVAL